jgi:hypothetical protein
MGISNRIVGLLIITAFLIVSCDDKKNQAPGRGGARQQGPISVDGFVVSEKSISEDIEVPGSLLLLKKPRYELRSAEESFS